MLASTLLTTSAITLAGLLAAPAASSTTGESGVLSSYTQAYNAAEGRPMLVVLNPSADSGLDVAALREDESLDNALGNYVVAEIDASSEHGQQVHKLFKSAPLPLVVVISEEKKQVFKASGEFSAASLTAAVRGDATTVTANRPVAISPAAPATTAISTATTSGAPASLSTLPSSIVQADS